MSNSEVACPHCRSVDMARQVSAVVWEGRSAVTGVVGWMPGVGVSTHYGTVSTDLAGALSPPPAPPARTAWFVWIFVLLTCALCLAGVFAMFSNVEASRDAADPATAASATSWSPWALYAFLVSPVAVVVVVLAALLIRRLRLDHRWRQAMPDMAAVWNAAWYCGRCAIACFPSLAIPGQLLLGDRVDPGRFRSVVWQAGIVRSQQRRQQNSTPTAAATAAHVTTGGQPGRHEGQRP